MRDRDRALLKHYYREIKSYLPCSRKEKKRILKEIRGNVDSFLEDHPEADFEAIQTHFGTPPPDLRVLRGEYGYREIAEGT